MFNVYKIKYNVITNKHHRVCKLLCLPVTRELQENVKIFNHPNLCHVFHVFSIVFIQLFQGLFVLDTRAVNFLTTFVSLVLDLLQLQQEYS